MGMMINRRRVCGGEKSLLPSGYKQLEYIESTGTQYINTGIVPTIYTKVIDYVCLMSTGGSGWGSASNMEAFLWGVIGSNYSIYYCSRYWLHYDFNDIPLDSNPHRVEISSTLVKVDNIEKIPTESYTKRLNKTLYLFALNVEWSPFIHYYETGKRYKTEIYEGNTIVRNFIPCKNPQNVVGMYDIVNGVFYQSASSTAFVAGPEV